MHHRQKSLKNFDIFVSLMSDSSLIPSVQVPRPSMRSTPSRSRWSGTDSRPVQSFPDFRVRATQLAIQLRINSKRPKGTRNRRRKRRASGDDESRSLSISRCIIFPQVLSEYFGRPVAFEPPGRGSVRWSTFASSSIAAAIAITTCSICVAARMQDWSASSAL